MVASILLLAATLTFVGAVVVAPLGRFSRRLQEYFAVAVATVTFISVASIVPEVFQAGEVKLDLPWANILGPIFTLRVDGLSILFALVASLFALLLILYSVGDMKGKGGSGRYYVLMMIFSGSMLGLFLADNLLLFFYFWEVVGLCSYFLIGFDCSRESSRASTKALLMISYAGAFLLIGILLMYFSTGTLLFSQIGVKLREPVAAALVVTLFLLAAMAKSAQFPLHTWLPDATVAPSAVIAYLSVAEAGAYLVARSYATFSNHLPAVSYEFAIATIGVVTLTVGCMAAWVQRDVKRLLAFSTVGQVGYIFFGIGLGTPLGVAGGLFHFLNHSFFKGLLFLCAGCLIYSTGTKRLDEMGGIFGKMPLTALSMLVGALSLGGVPPLNGFVSKLMIYEASIEKGMATGGVLGGVYVLYCVLAMFGSAVSLATIIKVINSAFFGQLPERLKTVKEVPANMYVPLLALSVICLVLGVAPQLAISYFVDPAVQVVVGGGVKTTILGVVTSIGFYEATTIATLIFIPLVLGAVIYWRMRPKRASLTGDKYGVFVGGEVKKPYVDMEKFKVDEELFTFAPVQMFSRFYRFMWRGGLDRIYLRLAESFIEAASHIRRTHVGIINIYSIWIVLGAIILMILIVI